MSGREVGAVTPAAAKMQEFQSELVSYRRNFEQVLPPHVSVDKFVRLLNTAVSIEPNLLWANRRTFYTSAIKCASDGLLPDGREAALVIFPNTRIKIRDPKTGLDKEIRIDAVVYMPMVAGLRKRLRNTGELASVECEVVCRNDTFHYRLGDDPMIEHEAPPLGEERGDVVGAYAIIRLTNGEVIRDVMSRKDIDVRRNASRAKEGLMWTTYYHEGAKKTVLRHAMKNAPSAAELERLLGDDETEIPPPELDAALSDPATRAITYQPGMELPPLLSEAELAAAVAAEPEGVLREPMPAQPASQARQAPPPATSQAEFNVIDLDSRVWAFKTPETAADGLRRVFDAAAKFDEARIIGMRESNEALFEALRQAGHRTLAAELLTEFEFYCDTARKAAQGRVEASPAPGPTVAPEVIPPSTAPAARPAAANDAPPFPGGEPALLAAPEPPSEPGKHLLRGAPSRDGKADWSVWARAIFLPKCRAWQDEAEYPYFLADNDGLLTAARAALRGPELAELNAAIDHQWTIFAK